jgi:CMP-N-acetylneuraminic acid synthetase
MQFPLLTVYITNYNYGHYIKQAIESVLNQSFQNFELFIIDDGSTDNSRKIIESYESLPNVKIIFQKNKGLNITNNIALRLSNSKYIMRLDADDYLESTALEKMVNMLEDDPELGLVFPDYYLIDNENNITAEIKRHDFDEEVTMMDQPAHGACTVIRTEFLKAVGGYDESYTCQDGYELWIKFISHFKVSNIKESLFYYRQHGENLTSNESRILDTRRKIKGNFIEKNEIQLPVTIGIIPVRRTRLGKEVMAFSKLGESTLLDIKIQSCLESSLLHKVIVTSSDKEINSYVSEKYHENKKLVFVSRPEELERFNVSLNGTIENVVSKIENKEAKVEAFMILPLEFPFLSSESIDDAINTLAIFKAHSLISVRTETASFYHHYGEGMVPILNQENFTKLEREALYKGVGGMTLSRLENFRKEQKLLAGKVSHVVLDEQSAHGIFSIYDYNVAKYLFNSISKAIKT